MKQYKSGMQREEKMINYKECLEQQQKELMKLERAVAEKLKGYKGLERGNIRVGKSNGCNQYKFKEEGKAWGRRYFGEVTVR